MRDHHDELVARDFLEKLHHLHARIGIERAGRFVGQQNVRLVYQRAGDGDALHLAARELIGALMQLVSKPDPLERFLRALSALRPADAGNGQRELDVRQNRLMGDQIIALKNKADGVIAIGIPVAIPVFLRGNSVDDQIAAVIAVQAADNVQQRRFARPARPQHGDEFIVPQVQVHIIQRPLHEVAGLICL